MSAYKIGEILEVSVEKIVPNGLGLAFAENLTVFVSLSAVGDKLRVKLNQIKGNTAFAEIVEIIGPSYDRVQPPCVYFGECGGCNFQQMNYNAQLEAKVGIIRDCLHRIAKLDYDGEIPIIASPAEFGYRSRAQWHLDTRNRKIGYYKRNSRDLIDVRSCPILTPILENTLEITRKNLDWHNFWSEKAEIEASHGDGDEVSVYSPEVIEPTNEISFSAFGERYFYSAQTFFQGNHFVVEKLLETALDGAGGETSLDLYCGVGLFTLPLAGKYARVIGVEEYGLAVDFARKNAENAQLPNIEFHTESVRKFLASAELGKVDFILLDPPRAGTEKETIHNIIKLGAPHISYVACEPSVLARDLKRFAEHGYKIDSITALDLFPQTHHVETVVRLSRL